MKGSMKKLAVFVVIGAIATFIAAAIASADDKDWKTLHGEYAFTGQATCINSPGGFSNQTAILNDKLRNTAATLIGTFTFKHDGTGVRQAFVDLIDETSPPSYNTSETTLPFTYTLDPDGAIEIIASGPFTGTILTGPLAGATFSIVDNGTIIGWLSKNTNSLVLATFKPAIETMTVVLPNGFHIPTFRICNYTSVLVPLHKEREDH